MSDKHNKRIGQILKVSAIIVILSLSFFAAIKIQPSHSNPYTLNVDASASIYKISPGMNVTLTASGLNGSAPYSYRWFCKVWQDANTSEPFTLFSTTNPAAFTLNQSCAYINFGVQVTDAKGNFGENYTITVYDPAALSTMYSEAGIYPSAKSYTVWAENDIYYAKNAYGAIPINPTSNASLLFSEIYITSGVCVYIPSNVTIYLTNPIDMKYANDALEGDGASSVIAWATGTNLNNNLIKVENADSCKVESLNVQGSANSAISYGIYLGVSTDCDVLSNYVSGFTGDGIHVWEGYNNHITNNHVALNGYHGVELEQTASDIVLGNTITGNNRDGIYALGSTQCTIGGNTIQSNNQSGIVLAHALGDSGQDEGPTTEFSVYGNTIKSNLQCGLVIYNSSYDNIINGANMISHNGQEGVWLYAAQDNEISGNFIFDNSQSSNGTYAEVLLDNTGSAYTILNTIGGNHIYDDGSIKAGYGIAVTSTSDSGNFITGDFVYGQTIVPIQDFGTNAIHNCMNGTLYGGGEYIP